MPTPTTEELEHLVEACRRDPGGSSFVKLGEMYLALGRPRDAVEVGARGLKANAKNLDGRMMVSQAFVALHQWKQAQAELLKVVKADRSRGAGFKLLGEVLMRRGDYDRALPVLQHAQNLTPADPSVLAMLKRARVQQPLDAPPAIPTPLSPAQSAPRLPKPSAGGLGDNEPTRVAPDHGASMAKPAAVDMSALRHDATVNDEMAPEMLEDPTDQVDLGPPPVRDRLPLMKAPTADVPAISAAASAPLAAAAPVGAKPPPSPGAKKPPAPPGKPKVRPRIIPSEKPTDAARGALRQSAAMGENYINNLLSNGLFDVPNVRVPESEYDLTADKHWGRSSKKMFVGLFVFFFVTIGSLGGWYFYAKKKRDKAIAQHLKATTGLLKTGTYGDVCKAIVETQKAIEQDKGNMYTSTVFLQTSGVASLLYQTFKGTSGFLAASDVLPILRDVQTRLAEKKTGKRELLIAEVGLELATLSGEKLSVAARRVDSAIDKTSEWLKEHPDDLWVRWLLGKARLAAGDWSGAETSFDQVEKKGFILGSIELANMRLDEGKFDDAMAAYDGVLRKVKNHPLAIIGQSLARAEHAKEIGQAKGRLNEQIIDKDKGRLVSSYENLTLAYIHYDTPSFKEFRAALSKSAGVRTPRYLARVALARVAAGDIGEAVQLRSLIRFYSMRTAKHQGRVGFEKAQVKLKNGDIKSLAAEMSLAKNAPKSTLNKLARREAVKRHPLVRLVDAELLLAYGLPNAAIAAAGKQKSYRAHIIRGRALIELNDPANAVLELEAALKISSESRIADAWLQVAISMSKKKGERAKAFAELLKLRQGFDNQLAPFVYGYALMKLRNRRGLNLPVGASAEKEFNNAIKKDENDPDMVSPMRYRAYIGLAEIAFRKKSYKEALKHLQEALKLVPGNVLALRLQGMTLLALKQYKLAVASLGEVVYERGADKVDMTVDLSLAEAYVHAGVTDATKIGEALQRALKKGAAKGIVERIAKLAFAAKAIDKKVFEDLNLPLPDGAGDDKDAKDAKKTKKRPKRRRRRGRRR